MPVCVLFRYCSFLPQSENMQVVESLTLLLLFIYLFQMCDYNQNDHIVSVLNRKKRQITNTKTKISKLKAINQKLKATKQI